MIGAVVGAIVFAVAGFLVGKRAADRRIAKEVGPPGLDTFRTDNVKAVSPE